MSDIVERLQDQIDSMLVQLTKKDAEIERLRAEVAQLERRLGEATAVFETEEKEIERLRAALKNLLECLDLAERNDDLPLPFAGYGHVFLDEARAALRGKNP